MPSESLTSHCPRCRHEDHLRPAIGNQWVRSSRTAARRKCRRPARSSMRTLLTPINFRLSGNDPRSRNSRVLRRNRAGETAWLCSRYDDSSSIRRFIAAKAGSVLMPPHGQPGRHPRAISRRALQEQTDGSWPALAPRRTGSSSEAHAANSRQE